MKTKLIANETLFTELGKFLTEGRTVELTVKGNSMNPFLMTGRDTIVLAQCSREQIVPGAFVLGKDSFGRWVAHRVTAVEGDVLTLNGDGNFIGSTEKMAVSDVAAIVVGYVRNGKRGTMDGRAWKSYSAFWRFAGKMRIGSWSLRRIILGVWRRLPFSWK